MHPLAGSRNRLALYFLAWIPLSGILLMVLASRGGIGWGEASIHALGLGLSYALIGLPIWYICRANPLRASQWARVVITHLAASTLFASLWQMVASFWALVSSLVGHGSLGGTEAGLLDRLEPQFRLLFAIGVLFYLLIATFYYLLLAFEGSRRAERRENRLQVLATTAELRALKAQINPHFLFNSLNSISSLTTRDPEGAREMCVRLADFLRKSLGAGDRALIPLQEELALVDDYLAVEKVRLGARLGVERNIAPETRRLLVPSLLLQPLVENAILHGVAMLSEGGTVRLEAARHGSRLVISVQNPFDPDSPGRRGSGKGIEIVRKRVEAVAGQEGALRVERGDRRFQVTLTLEARESE